MRLRPLLTALAALLLLAAPATAQQTYPTRSVRVIVPFAAGGGADVVARAIAQKLSERLGQSFVVDNRAGGAGTIGTELVARAPADGYTLLVIGPNHTTSPSLFDRLPFDPIADFAPVALLTAAPYILLAHPSVPATSFGDVVALAKARPGAINYGSASNGSAGHLAMEAIKSRLGINLVHVPYKGSPQALADLIAGQVSFMFDNILSSSPHVAAGRLRAIATSGARRTPFLPDVPTIAEQGLPGFDVTVWQGLLAPAGTSPAVIAVLNEAVNAALASADLRERLQSLGVEVAGGPPDTLGRFLVADIEKWRVVIRESGARMD